MKGITMTQRDIATLACKIMALWFYVQAVINWAGVLIGFFIALTQPSAHGGSTGNFLTQYAVISLTVGGAYLMAGLVLWFGAARLASGMTKDDDALALPGITLDSAMTVGFAVVGAWWLVASVRDVTEQVIVALHSNPLDAPYWRSPDWLASIGSALVQLAFSLWLIFGSRGLVRLVMWARAVGATHGHRSESVPPSPPSPQDLG
jgi:hypothetical protein